MLRQISTKKMLIAKWLPVLVAGAILALMWFSELTKPTPNLNAMLIVSAICVAAVLWVQVRGPWRHLDQVLEDGDFLVIRKGREEDQVPLSSITDMWVSTEFGSTTLVLSLSVPCRFGTRVSFLADKEWVESPAAEELHAKIKKVQRGVA